MMEEPTALGLVEATYHWSPGCSRSGITSGSAKSAAHCLSQKYCSRLTFGRRYVVRRYLSNTASFVLCAGQGAPSFATGFLNFQENLRQTGSLRQVVPPDHLQQRPGRLAGAPLVRVLGSVLQEPCRHEY